MRARFKYDLEAIFFLNALATFLHIRKPRQETTDFFYLHSRNRAINEE